MTRTPGVDHLRGVVLTATDLAASVRFYEQAWGLLCLEERSDHAVFRALGPEYQALRLEAAAKPRLARIDLAVRSVRDLDDLHASLTAKQVCVVTPPSRLREAGGGYGMDVLDHEGRLVRISADLAEHAPIHDDSRPIRISHIVLNSPDLEACRLFYSDAFGFVLSDKSADQMLFLRCGTTHYDIAFNQAETISLNHISYELHYYGGVYKAVERVTEAGVPVSWGIGCHGINGSMFAYFIDPSGFVVEYSCQMRSFDPVAHVPTTWERTSINMDAWGTARPPAQDFLDAMAGLPQRAGD